VHVQPAVQTQPETITFVVDGDPVPQPRARVSTRGGFARAYVPRGHAVHAYRQAIEVAAQAAGITPTEDAVSVWLTFTFGRPKSHMTKRGVKKTAPALPREDVDNLAKAVLGRAHLPRMA
jgi:Holliday junction resolvase RusA-like endonuclease